MDSCSKIRFRGITPDHLILPYWNVKVNYIGNTNMIVESIQNMPN